MYYIKSVSYQPASNQNETHSASVINWNEVKSDSICPNYLQEVASNSPTELGSIAAKKALDEAKLSTADIELVIGESATPMQVTPSEGQRIAGNIGIKTVTFDIQSGSSSFGACVEYLINLKENKANNVLWVSANTPTRLVENSTDSKNFSDAGAAVVLSKNSGIAKIVYVKYESNLDLNPIVRVKPYSEIIFSAENIEKVYSTYIKKSLEKVLLKVKNKENVKIILPSFSKDASLKILADLNLNSEQLVESNYHDSLGSSFTEPLAKAINQASTNEIVIIQAGAGLGVSALIIEKV